MAVLDVQNLTLSFGERTLFAGVSFSIKEREKVGFVGANGVGKTSLFKVICGDYTPDSGGVFLSKNCKLGYMEQHTCSAGNTVWNELVSVFAPLMELERQLEEVGDRLRSGQGDTAADIALQDRLTEQFQREGGLTYKSMTRSALLGLGFTEKQFDMSTDKLSGGQKSKLILAKLLLSKADFLLLDEPTNHLDIHAVEWLENFLSDFKGACLIVSHDRYFLDRITDKTIELENQKIRCFSGNYSVFLQKKAAEQKAIAEKYDNDMKEIARLEGIIAQQRQWNREKNIKTAESKEKVIQRIRDQLVVPDAKLQKIRFDFSPKCVSGEDVLSCDGLSKSFDGKALFRDVSFDIKRQERVFLLGDNGCGKTTLLKILTGEYPRQDGTFRFGSNLLTGYFDQVQAKLDLTKTVIGEMWDTFPQMTETRVRNAMAAFLFKGEEVYRPLSVCSGGERARVALLKLMLGGYNFLLLDEPTNHLDAASREELENTLLHYDGTMLIVSHDRYFINKLATRVLELTPNGVQSYTGNYDDYMAHRAVTQQRTAAVKEKPKTNSYKEQKERASRLRKLRTAVTRLEAEIEETEAEIEELQAQLSAGADYQALMDLTAKLDAATARRDDLYARWENASEELAAGEEEV